MSTFTHIFLNKKDNTKDQLGAYPERLNVKALPERRYLKTSRFLVIAAVCSLLFNFALCFIFIRNTKQIEAIIQLSPDKRQDSLLFYLDYYNKTLKPIEKTERILDGKDLLFKNMITDYLKRRYEFSTNIPVMEKLWNNGKLSSYLGKKPFEAFLDETKLNLIQMNQKNMQRVFIHDIQRLAEGSYEAIFDTFLLKADKYNTRICNCFTMDETCLTCLEKNAISAKRYKGYFNVVFEEIDKEKQRQTDITASVNPYHFAIRSQYVMPYSIPRKIGSPAKDWEYQESNQWEDVKNILH